MRRTTQFSLKLPNVVADKPGTSLGKFAFNSLRGTGGHQTKSTKSFSSESSASGSKSKSNSLISGPSGLKLGLGATKKLGTKALNGTEDDEYSSEEESDDERKGGRRMLPLLKKVSKPCHRKGETKKMVRCVGSKGK